jgi:hypothetical protein
LANPAVFGLLDLRTGTQLRVTKRDCKTWFDQLLLAPDLRGFFGRPRVSRDELLAEGLTMAQLATFGAPASGAWLVPCSRVWPMGFSWSSCVAQDTLLRIASDGGLSSELVLAADHELPRDLALAFAVATGDLMIFSDRGPGATTAATDDFEASLAAHGVVKNGAKDLDDVLDATCVGVSLVNGTLWAVPPGRLWACLDAVIDLNTLGRTSPGTAAAHLCSVQWYDLLRRLRLCVFDSVYTCCSGSLAKDWTIVDAPRGVL